MVLEGPLIHHLEVSKQGFVCIPFGKLMTYHSKPFGESTLYTVISPFKTTIANGFKWCINLYEKGTKSRRVNVAAGKSSPRKYCDGGHSTMTLPPLNGNNGTNYSTVRPSLCFATWEKNWHQENNSLKPLHHHHHSVQSKNQSFKITPSSYMGCTHPNNDRYLINADLKTDSSKNQSSCSEWSQ